MADFKASEQQYGIGIDPDLGRPAWTFPPTRSGPSLWQWNDLVVQELYSQSPTNKRNARSSNVSLADRWPYSCEYFDPETMDAEKLRSFLGTDDIYPPNSQSKELLAVRLSDDNAMIEKLALNNLSIPEKGTTSIIFVQQTRIWEENRSICHTGMSSAGLETLLSRLQVYPSFMRLLHNNNGGSASYMTEVSTKANEATTNRSYHLMFKLGSWLRKEMAIYARHNFDTNSDLILFFIRFDSINANVIRNRFEAAKRPHLFAVLLEIFSMAFIEVERVQWQLDFATLNIESRTISNGTRLEQRDSLSPDDMRFNRELQRNADGLRGLLYGSHLVNKGVEFLLNECQRSDRQQLGVSTRIREEIKSLESATHYQGLQISELQKRTTSQIFITDTFMAQRDSRSNLLIARAVQEDSKLMRGFSAVAYFSLPATAIATFFSMVFFHVGDETTISFRVDSKIWLYFAVLVPIFAITALYYRLKIAL